ncbi:MAG: hypothetical protein BroJett003_12110 [Planctomycetota bacterium]|nr:MAG: hypothetical protein BroJett003_12110 [Planctomycetota bacterium]
MACTRLPQAESSDEFRRRPVAAGIDYCVITVGTGITEHSAPSRFASDWVPRFLQRIDPQALNNLPQMSVAYLDERGVCVLGRARRHDPANPYARGGPLARRTGNVERGEVATGSRDQSIVVPPPPVING